MSEEGLLPGTVHQVADAVAAPVIPLTLDGIATAVHDKKLLKFQITLCFRLLLIK